MSNPSSKSSTNQPLTSEETRRYARHLVLPEVGAEGQRKLKSSSVLVVGAGGLGSPVCMYLAAAGVGRIGIVDFDHVDESNLQRQVIHFQRDVGRRKVDSAAETIRSINPAAEVVTYSEPFNADNALSIADEFDLVIDGTDNFGTRYLVNDVCVLLGKPNCYGSIFRFEGQASVFGLPGGPCYRCLYPQPPDPGLIPNCAEGGVLGVLPGIVGTIQATEAIKQILGIGESLKGRLLLIDALEMSFRELAVSRDSNCPMCGDHPTITKPVEYEQYCGGPTRVVQQTDWDIDPEELKRRIDAEEEFVIVDVREPHEYEICHLGGRLIPLGELSEHLHEFQFQQTMIVHCKSGGRSAKAVRLMRDAGIENVFNLNGGIERWRNEIDPSIPKY